MRCNEVIERLELLSPVSFAEKWDNVGLLVGRMDQEIASVYLAVDVTDKVLEEAVLNGADMIISHHPLIFDGLKRITEEDFIGRRVRKLIEENICYYAMHTNFDILGMADAAAEEIKLVNSQVLHTTYEDDISKEGFGRFGKLHRPMTLLECAEFVKRRFLLENVTVYGDLRKSVEIAAICPGAGKDFIEDAVAVGADVYITGDISHHAGIDAVARDLMIIDAGHYGIEKIFIPYMKDYIKRQMPQIKVFTEETDSPFRVI